MRRLRPLIRRITNSMDGLTLLVLSRPIEGVQRPPLAHQGTAWFDKSYLAVGLVLLALLTLTSVYRPRSVAEHQQRVVKTQSTPVNQRNLKLTSFATAIPAVVHLPLPAPAYVRQPLHAARTLSPRRLPGAYFNRPPPSLLS